MRARGAVADSRPERPGPEPADGLQLFETANLPTEKTGVAGVVYISAAQGSHAPRVEWYPARPATDAPCRSACNPVQAWVALNSTALLDFSQHGSTWMDDEVSAFKNKLKTLPVRG